MKEKGILFKGEMVRAIQNTAEPIRRVACRRSVESPISPNHLMRRLFAGSRETASGCFEWLRYLNNHGYGGITISGRRQYVHRVSYELFYGRSVSGQMVLHACDNPRCWNPAHLFLGDQSKNMADCASKNRTCKGEKNGQAKLTKHAVNEMRAMYSNGLTQQEIGSKFGVAQSTVARALKGISWK